MIAVTDGANEWRLKGPDAMSHAVSIEIPNLAYGNLWGGPIKIAKIRQFLQYPGGIHADCVTVSFIFSGSNLTADTG